MQVIWLKITPPPPLNDCSPGPSSHDLGNLSRNQLPKGVSVYVLQGSECCSQFSISFHRMTPQEILVFDHLLYRTSVYGRHVAKNIPEFFKHAVMKKTPNGLPTMKTS